MASRKHQPEAAAARPVATAARLKEASARAAIREKAVRLEMAELAPKLPDIDPHDLHLILTQMHTPIRERRIFLRRKDGRFVF